jgi:hypothetical protein
VPPLKDFGLSKSRLGTPTRLFRVLASLELGLLLYNSIFVVGSSALVIRLWRIIVGASSLGFADGGEGYGVDAARSRGERKE